MEFYSENKFEKLVFLVGCIVRILLVQVNMYVSQMGHLQKR